MKIKIIITVLVIFNYLALNDGNAQTSVTTGTLFEDMVDLVKLTKTAEPFYRTVQFSSYDRTSKIPNGPGWFANSDGFGGEPTPNFEKILKEPGADGVGEYLMLDLEGPGAIVRLWTASINGNLKVYIDNIDKPLYEGSAEEFFRFTYNVFPQIQNISLNRFEKTIYQRDASYAPVAFKKRLRIEWTGKIENLHFYEVQVKLFDKDTKVRSFNPEDISEFSESIDKVTEVLLNPDKNYNLTSDLPEKQFQAIINPSEKKEVLAITGQQAAVEFTIKLEAQDIKLALRQTILHVICDEFPQGQVQSPVGDFFGAAPGINPYISMPFSVLPDGTMKCRFVMPFKKSIKFVLENYGHQEVTASGSVCPIHYSWDKNSMYFQALWRANHNINASNKEVSDIPFILAYGEGTYVGTTAYLLNTTDVPTPWGNWWGEGDEKIFVDNEPFPSIFGTGSEDYFNYSWSSPDIFLFPYCGQPVNDGPGNRGFITNYRWHISDPIPFKHNIRFYMELYTHLPVEGFSYSRIGYHYTKPGSTNDHISIQPEDVRELKLAKKWKPVASLGSHGSLFYPAEDILITKGNTIIKPGNLWEGGKLLVWKPKKVGEQKDFTIKIDEKELRNILITVALTPNSGEIALYFNGKKLKPDNSGEIDLYRDHRTLSRNFSIGTVSVEPGDHILSIEYLGCKEFIDNPEIGIDFIWVQNPKF